MFCTCAADYCCQSLLLPPYPYWTAPFLFQTIAPVGQDLPEFCSCSPECLQIMYRVEVVCTHCPRTALKYPIAHLESMLKDDPYPEPLGSHSHRAGVEWLCMSWALTNKNVMQSGITSSAYFMTWSHLLWFSRGDPLIVLRRNFGCSELLIKVTHVCLLLSG